MSEHNDEHLPRGHVVAVIDADTAGRALEGLEREGFSATHLFTGHSAEQVFDAKGEHSGLIAKAVKAVQEHLSEEPNYLAQYQEEARHGNAVIAVKVDNRNQAAEVGGVLEQQGARNVRHFGTLAVSDLTPGTNPSLRSEDSPEEQAKT